MKKAQTMTTTLMIASRERTNSERAKSEPRNETKFRDETKGNSQDVRFGQIVSA